ncbi:MAG: hypothetical protein A3I66_10580 [Burkholderiales bacterium RIFCSPLOWO2_02_FULL_57_36]|nr:MAG: hypothetical protein A3I66_10580 [Burkholderiales bacterium RIFCSPLOWO2_02_FULL_57_36]
MSTASRASPKRGITSKRWWPWAKRLFTWAFFAAVAYLLVTQALSIEWGKVIETMRRRPLEGLLIAAVLAAGSFTLYSCFDLLGRHITGHRMSTRKVMTVTFISYVFNLNFGALVGGFAFRYRLYSRHGLDAEVITRVLAMSMLTNWLGYIFLAGLAFWWAPISPPPSWKIDAFGLDIFGMVLFAAAIAYLLMCALSRRRTWTVRGHELSLPSLRLALLQLSMSSANWLLIAGVMYTLLEQKIAFPTVLGVLLVAAIAGVITHVPAGLGVLEAVFVALLSHQVPVNELLAGMLTYRAIYYLAPLVLATLVYLLVEARTKKVEPSG